jgi:hypothetical protein
MKLRIPNIFHFIFGLKPQTEPFHLVFYLCLESCLQVNKPEKLFFYYHYEPYGKYWDLIKNKITLVKVELSSFLQGYEYKDKLVAKYSYAHLADIIRLEKLIEFGGVYADIDTIFVNKIPEKLFEKKFVLGKENDFYVKELGISKASLCNALIMSEAGSEFCQIWLKTMPSVFDGSWSTHSCQLAADLQMKHPDLIHVEPSRSFYKHAYTKQGLKSLLNECDRDFEDVFSIHLWNHLWWEKYRFDFSLMHEGRFTENYINYVDTTYNVIARKFLPEQSATKAVLKPIYKLRQIFDSKIAWLHNLSQ